MKEERLSLREIMKTDLSDELLHGTKVSNLAFHLGRRLGLSYEKAVELVKDNIDFKVTIADNSYLQMKDLSNLSSLAMLKEVFDRLSLINTEVSEVHAKDIIDQEKECIDEIDFEEESSGVISKIKNFFHKLF